MRCDFWRYWHPWYCPITPSQVLVRVNCFLWFESLMCSVKLSSVAIVTLWCCSPSESHRDARSSSKLDESTTLACWREQHLRYAAYSPLKLPQLLNLRKISLPCSLISCRMCVCVCVCLFWNWLFRLTWSLEIVYESDTAGRVFQFVPRFVSLQSLRFSSFRSFFNTSLC